MSCSSPLKFPDVVTEKVAEPSWLNASLTGFERLTGGFVDLLHPGELPFNELLTITVGKDDQLKIEPHTELRHLINLAKQHEIAIAVVSLLPFVLLLLMGFCYCLLCMERCLCCKKAKPKVKALTTPIVFLFLSGTMLSVAIYSISSSRALDKLVTELPDEIVKSIGYIPLYAKQTKKILDGLLSTDIDIFTQHMNQTAMRGECILERMTVGNDSESVKMLMDTFDEKQKETAASRERFRKSCAGAASNPLCKEETSKLQNGIEGLKSTVAAAASSALALLKQATDPLKAVRGMSDNLISSASQVNRFSEEVLKHKEVITQYDYYRSLITSTYAIVTLLISLGLFISAVLLLLSLGPDGGSCQPPMSKDCIKRLLTSFTFFAHLIAFLGSIVFSVFFFLGANLHLACRPLQDVEAAKGFVGTFSKIADQYLHTKLKTILAGAAGSTTIPIFEDDDISNIVKRLSVAGIIHDCKERKTVFVILKLDTLDLPSKLSRMFEKQLHELGGGGGKTKPDGGRHTSKGKDASHFPHGGPPPGSYPGQRPEGEPPFGPPGSNMKDKQSRPGQERGRPPYETGTGGMPPRHERPPGSGRMHSLSGRVRKEVATSFKPEELINFFQKLQDCMSQLTQSLATTLANCKGNDYDSLRSNLESLANVSSRIASECPSIAASATNTSLSQLAKETVIYAEHINKALKNDILPCDVVIYSIGGLVNAVCWRAVRIINCWSFAGGLWCYLVIFTVCYSRSVRGMLVVPRQKKPREGSES